MQGTKTVQALTKAVAETYALMAKSHGYHWNVTGPYFKELHDLFQVQYEELFLAVDEIAEQLRTLGALAPCCLDELAKASALAPGTPAADDQAMLEDLAASNEAVLATCRAALRVAEQAGDDTTVDLMTQRMRAHGKAVWMLRASMAARASKAAVAPAVQAAAPAAPKPKKKKSKASGKAEAKPDAKAKSKAGAPEVRAAVAAKPAGRPKSNVRAEG